MRGKEEEKPRSEEAEEAAEEAARGAARPVGHPAEGAEALGQDEEAAGEQRAQAAGRGQPRRRAPGRRENREPRSTIYMDDRTWSAATAVEAAQVRRMSSGGRAAWRRPGGSTRCAGTA